jgi:hypothetical protein
VPLQQFHVRGGEPTRSEADATLERHVEVDLASQELKSYMMMMDERGQCLALLIVRGNGFSV